MSTIGLQQKFRSFLYRPLCWFANEGGQQSLSKSLLGAIKLRGPCPLHIQSGWCMASTQAQMAASSVIAAFSRRQLAESA
jgi:hypothetical protein